MPVSVVAVADPPEVRAASAGDGSNGADADETAPLPALEETPADRLGDALDDDAADRPRRRGWWQRLSSTSR